MKPLLIFLYETIMYLTLSLPRFGPFSALKSAFLRSVGAQIGRSAAIYPGVWVAPGRGLCIGDDVDLALGVILSTSGGISIGDRTLVGYRTQILSTNHIVGPVGTRIYGAGHSKKPIVIGSDVWIGANCTILAGVTVGDGAVVAAGSVVTKDIPANSIACGVPARVMRMRDTVE